MTQRQAMAAAPRRMRRWQLTVMLTLAFVRKAAAAEARQQQHEWRLEPLEPSRVLARRGLQQQFGPPDPPSPPRPPPRPPPPTTFFSPPPTITFFPPIPFVPQPPSPPQTITFFPPIPFVPQPPSPPSTFGGATPPPPTFGGVPSLPPAPLPPPPLPPRPPFPNSPPLPPRPPRPPPFPPAPPPSPVRFVIPPPRSLPPPSLPPAPLEPPPPPEAPSPPSPPIAAGLPPTPPPPPSQPLGSAGAGAGGKSGASAAAAAGGAVGGAAALCALLVGGAVWWRRRRRAFRLAAYGGGGDDGGSDGKSAAAAGSPRHGGGTTGTVTSPLITTPELGSVNDSAATPRALHATLDPGTHGLAFQFPWTAASPLHPQPVEAGLNDVRLDRLASADGECPVVQLTAAQVAQELQLLTDGLLGKGGTAVVFKGLWPSRFGPDALLAVKVLSNAWAGNESLQRSFQREAELLAASKHPNIVRLYGYCVEPPRVCLVLELLPCSLSARIHGASPDAATGTTGTTGASSSGGSSRAGSPAKPATTTAYLTAVEGQPAAHGLPATEDDDSSGPPSSTSSSGGGGKGEQKGADEAAAPAVVAHKAAQQPQPLAPLTMLDVVRISADIAAGLAFLHSLRARVDDDGGGVGAGGVALGMRRVREDELELGEEDWHSAVAEERAATADATRIVHRDLKPANVLLSSRGVAKLSDFGLARPHHHETVSSITVMGAGTSKYMAPELLLARYTYAQAVTNRVDIYSLGVLMWEMLSGELPWREHTTEASLVLAVVRKNQRPPLPLPPAIGGAAPQEESNLGATPASLHALPELNQLVDECWQQRDLRRPSAEQVRQRLEELLRTHA